MGYEIGKRIAASGLPLEEMMSWHLTGNHEPPVDEVFIPVAVEAIILARRGIWDQALLMPNGLSRTVEFIVDNLHLGPFIPEVGA